MFRHFFLWGKGLRCKKIYFMVGQQQNSIKKKRVTHSRLRTAKWQKPLLSDLCYHWKKQKSRNIFTELIIIQQHLRQ